MSISNGSIRVESRAMRDRSPYCGTGVLARRWSLDIWKTEIVLRRSKIFIATGIQIAVSSVGAAYYG